MNLPDRIRIEYDGALHSKAAARVVDLDTGQEVQNVVEINIRIQQARLVAELRFYDHESSNARLSLATITRAYAMPDLDMHYRRPAPPAPKSETP